MKYKPYRYKKEANKLFQILPFYNTFIENLKIMHLSNTVLLHELPFFDKLSVVEILKAFRRYARSYKVEIIDSKDPLARLEASKSSIEDLFKDFLNEMKGFKYQITVKILLCIYRMNGDKEFGPVYFNSATKTKVNSDEYMLDKFEGSGWIIESIESQYMNISIYSPLIGSRYTEVPDKL